MTDDERFSQLASALRIETSSSSAPSEPERLLTPAFTAASSSAIAPIAQELARLIATQANSTAISWALPTTEATEARNVDVRLRRAMRARWRAVAAQTRLRERLAKRASIASVAGLVSAATWSATGSLALVAFPAMVALIGASTFVAKFLATASVRKRVADALDEQAALIESMGTRAKVS